MIKDSLINRYISMMMPNADEEQLHNQRVFLEKKTENELRQVINDCYDLKKQWGKKKKCILL